MNSNGVRRRLSRRLLYSVDVARAGITIARALLVPKRRPLVLGFFVNKSEMLLRHAVCPEAAFIRMNALRMKRGWSTERFAKFVSLLADCTSNRNVTAIVWGYRDRKNHGLDVDRFFDRCIRVERGIINPPRAPNLAFVAGDKSIYFDGRESTDLEKQLNALEPGRLPQSPEGQRLLQYIIDAELTKYACSSETAIRPTERDLIIVGQCTGDQAVLESAALATSNTGLVDLAARQLLGGDHGFDRIFYKPHPKNKTNAADIAYVHERYPDITIIADGVSIIPLLKGRPTVATLTSGVGLEAAVRNCTVHTFGIPFYSHWGFTIDHMPCDRRTNRLSPEDVFLFMLIRHTQYADPQTKQPISAMEAFGLSPSTDQARAPTA